MADHFGTVTLKSSIGGDNDDNISNSDAEINFEDISDIEDPSYTPQRDKNKHIKKNIPDYFHLHSRESPPQSKEAENKANVAYSSPCTLAQVMSPLSSSSSAVFDASACSSTSTLDSEDLMLKTLKSNYSYLDGKFFKLISLNEREKKVHGKCQMCVPKDVIIKGFLGVSTNFLKHMRKYHPKAMEDYTAYKRCKQTNKKRTTEGSADNVDIPKKQPKIKEMFQRSPLLNQVNQRTFDKKIIHFIISTMSPISIVENPAFINLFDGTGFNIMHRTTAVKKIGEVFLESINHIKDEMVKAQYVCTTVDVWSTKQRSFFGATAHWINEHFERCSAALACRRFAGTHTFDKIAEIMEDIHLQYNLSNNKLVATISDNGSNFVKAFREFGPSVDAPERDSNEEEDIEFLEISTNILPKHVRCASHTLNLIATTDIKNAIQRNTSLRTRHANTIAKCNALWKMAGKPKTNEIVKEVLGHTLSYPGATRWNSMYDSIAQILKEREHLEELFEKLSIKNQMFKDYELEYLTEYCSLLQPLASAIDILQGEKNTYFGYLLPCLGSLYKKIIRMESTSTNIGRPILEACRDGLLTRFKLFFNFSTSEAKEATIASFTLPQFKLKWKSCFQNFITDDLTESITGFIFEKGSEINLQETFETVSIEHKIPKVDNFFELDAGPSNYNDFVDSNHIRNKKKKIELEILQYLNDPMTDIESLNGYPFIKKLFFKFNTCLPSSAPVERLFSFAEIINSPRRHALSDKHFEELVVLKANLLKYNLL